MDFDDYEMKEREQEQEREQERAREELEEANQEEEETNFDDIEDVIIDIGKNTDQLENLDLDLDLDGGIPNVGKDVAGIKRSITEDIKKVFRDVFNVSVEKKNGKNSKDIVENTKFVSSKNGRISIEYKGSRIGWIEKSLNVNLFDKKNKKLVNEFRNSLELVKLEYEKSPSSLVRNFPEEVVDDILDSSIERISDEIDELTANLSEQELREFAGVLNPKGPSAEIRIKALETQADYWKKVRLEAEEVVRTDGASEYIVKKAKGEALKLESLEKTARLQADNERLKNNEKPIHDETLEIIDDEIQNSDLGKFERFKEWAKSNLIGLSAIAITIGGIITTVVIAGRRAVKSAAKATGKLAKALVNIGKKLGPLIAPLLNLMAQEISWGAKGLEFLSRNLWMIAVAFAWFLTKVYRDYKSYKK